MNNSYIYVTPFFPSPTNWRGSYCYDFVKVLKEMGQYNVIVMTPGTGEDYEIEGVKVHRFPTKQLPSNLFPFLFRRFNERSFLNKVRQVLITNNLQLSAVSVCHAHTANYVIYALTAKRTFGCQALLHHHDLQSFGLNLGVLRHCALYNAWLFCRMRKLFEQIDTHVFISEKSRESFLCAPETSWTIYDDYKKQMRGPRFFHCRPVCIKRSILLHNGVDTAIFNRKVEKVGGGGQRNGSSSEFVIGCIGNFIDLKDQATLIKAVAVLKESGKVIFVGSGPTLESCKKLACELKVDAEFRSEVRHELLPEFYYSLDLFVLPSYFEGFGCVLTEAYACGVPFIACRGQGADDLIFENDKDKWLFRARDDKELAMIIEKYIAYKYQQVLQCPFDIIQLTQSFYQKL